MAVCGAGEEVRGWCAGVGVGEREEEEGEEEGAVGVYHGR